MHVWHARRIGLSGWMTMLMAVSTWAAEPVAPPERMPVNEAIAAPRPTEQIFWRDEFPPQWESYASSRPDWLDEVRYRSDWIPGRYDDTLGDVMYGIEARLIAPSLQAESPWFITPRFAAHLLNGPTTIDVPGHLFETGIEFERRWRLLERLELEAAFAPSLASDFDQGSGHAFRVTGRVVGAWDFSPTMTFVAGATYLARRDYPVLPVVGAIWQPNDGTRVELVFPRPSAMRRIELPGEVRRWLDHPVAQWLGRSSADEFWLLASGELGGNSYAVRRASGESDLLTYKDLRFTIGYERRSVVGFVNRNEIGWVFDRRLDYHTAEDRYHLRDAFLFRSEYAY